MTCIVAVDIGGTDIKFGKFIDGNLIEKKRIPTNKEEDGELILPEVIDTVKALVGHDELVGLGVGIPGPVVDGFVLGAQNLRWKEKHVKDILKSHFPHVMVTVINDANAATLGEMIYGGGQGYNHFVFVTIGTGIGGGIVINQRLIEGSTGSCGEIGHLRVGFADERKCTCGLFDCVEQYASATGVVVTAYQVRVNRDTVLNDYNTLTSKIIFDCAKEGDVVACEVVDKMVEKLATALSQVANTINPEAFVIGGGVSKAGDFLLHKLTKRFRELAFFSVRDVHFALAKLGNDAGIYGNFYRVLHEINHGS